MKKIVLIILILVMTLELSACTSKKAGQAFNAAAGSNSTQLQKGGGGDIQLPIAP